MMLFGELKRKTFPGRGSTISLTLKSGNLFVCPRWARPYTSTSISYQNWSWLCTFNQSQGENQNSCLLYSGTFIDTLGSEVFVLNGELSLLSSQRFKKRRKVIICGVENLSFIWRVLFVCFFCQETDTLNRKNCPD